MASKIALIVVLCGIFAVAPARALDGAQIASDSATVQNGYGQQPQDGGAMQAVCHEILVDTDEGYGVTNHESRVVCDQSR